MTDANKALFTYLSRLEPASPKGSLTSSRIGDLRPTQNAVGMDEVEAKTKKIEAMSAERLDDYLLQRPIPVVIGNDGTYMIDHHHLARALWDADKRTISVPTVVVENWKPLDGDRFWKAMARRNWLYPFAGMGSGPQNPSALKPHVKKLENDLYRSLSWYVRKGYGYIKDPANPIFAEFKWASFFRSRVIFWDALLNWPADRLVDMTLADIREKEPGELDEMTAYALYLASSPEARGLPGFIGPGC